MFQVSVEKATEIAMFRKGLYTDDFEDDNDDGIGWGDDPVSASPARNRIYLLYLVY